jgi:hypothetical protein
VDVRQPHAHAPRANALIVRITAPHFCAGYDLSTGRIAPIIAYMRRWSVDRISDYCRRRGWEVEVIVTEDDG